MIHFFVFVFVLNTWFRGVPSIATFGNTVNFFFCMSGKM